MWVFLDSHGDYYGVDRASGRWRMGGEIAMDECERSVGYLRCWIWMARGKEGGGTRP